MTFLFQSWGYGKTNAAKNQSNEGKRRNPRNQKVQIRTDSSSISRRPLSTSTKKITPPRTPFLLVPLNNFRARSQCTKNSPRFSSWSKKVWSTPRRHLPCYPRPATSLSQPTKKKHCLICDWCQRRFSHFTGTKRCRTTWPALFWSQKLWCLLGHSK